MLFLRTNTYASRQIRYEGNCWDRCVLLRKLCFGSPAFLGPTFFILTGALIRGSGSSRYVDVD